MTYTAPDDLRISLLAALATVPASLFRELGKRNLPSEGDELRSRLVDEYLLPQRDMTAMNIMQNFGDLAPRKKSD